MENIIKILFLLMVFLVPLGMLAALGLVMQARKAATAGDGARANLLRRQAVERLGYSFATGFLGLIGYLLVSRNLIPALEPALILVFVCVTSFFVHFFIRRKLKLPKWKDWF